MTLRYLFKYVDVYTLYLQHSNIYRFTSNIHFHLINIEETKFQVHELVQNIFFLSVVSVSGGTKTLWKKRVSLYHRHAYFHSTWVHIKLLHHIRVLVIVMESPQHSRPPSQDSYLSTLSWVHCAPSRLPT